MSEVFKGNRQLTIHGFDPGVVRSAFQKAMRRGEEKLAIDCAMELVACGWPNAVAERIYHCAQEDIGYPGMDIILHLDEMLAPARNKNARLETRREAICKAVLIMCRSKHCHASAWLNMLSNRWPLVMNNPYADPPFAFRGKWPVHVYGTALGNFAQAVARKDITQALTLGSLVHIAALFQTDKTIIKENKWSLPAYACSEIVQWQNGTKKKKMPAILAELWTILLKNVNLTNVSNFIVRCALGGGRLELINAIMARMHTFQLQPFPQEKFGDRNLTHHFPPYFFNPDMKSHFLAGRNHVSSMPTWAVDKHTSIIHQDKTGYLKRIAAEQGEELTEEEIQRSHPDVPAEQATLEWFVREGTKMSNRDPEEEKWRDEGIAAYLNDEYDEGFMRAQHYFLSRMKEFLERMDVNNERKRKREE